MGCRFLVLTAVVLLSVESNHGEHQPILIGTVQLLSAKDKSSTSDIWAGYQLWEEHTNLQGGIRVGNVTRDVELRMYNSRADGIRPVDLYKRLVEDDKVDFLFIADSGSSRDLSEIASQHGIISIFSFHESNFDDIENRSLLYAVHRKDTKLTTEKFIRDVRSTWGLTRMALVWVEGAAGAASSHDGTSYTGAQECKGLQNDVNEGRLEGEIVLAEQLVDGQYSQTMARVDAAGVDFLVACIDNETEARSIMRAANAAGILIGWPGQVGQVHPLLVESSSLKFMYFTAAADSASFASTLGGLVQRTVSASPWQRGQSLSDPQFGSVASLEELWQDRVDYGNGRHLPAAAAAAIATGVVLRLAVEAAGSLETARVARALEELDSETVFGRVKFDADGWNTAPGGALVQWDCTMANKTECGKVVWPVVAGQGGAAGAGSGVLQPLHPKCPEGETWLDVEPVVDLVYAPDAAQGGLPREYLAPSYCIDCSRADMMWSWNLLKDTDSWNNFAKVCAGAGVGSSFAGVYKVGIAVMAGPGDEEWRLALPAFQLLFDWLETIGIGFLPYAVYSVDASDVGLGNHASIPAIRAAMAEVLESLGTQSPQWVIWNSGLVSFAASDVPVFPGPKCPGGGVQLSWDEMALCVQPALRLQGIVVARLVEHFAWHRCHVVVGAHAEYQEVWREFEALSSRLGIEVESRVTVPAQGDEERGAALDAVARFDDCRATVVVLLVGRSDAQAVFERVYGREVWTGGRRFVVVGVEAAGRAANAPEGMLSVRTVAQAENPNAQQVMALAKDMRQWGTGVQVAREAEGVPGATGADQAEADAWLVRGGREHDSGKQGLGWVGWWGRELLGKLIQQEVNDKSNTRRVVDRCG